MNSKEYFKQRIDRYFIRNTFGISGVEFFWGFGLPVVAESTFLQIFLSGLGASKTVIGFIPGIYAFGMALFSLLSAYLTAHLTHKRRAVILTSLAASIPLGIIGVILIFLGKTDFTIPLFLIFYILFAMGLGLVVPVWQNFTVKIFSEEKAMKGISIMMFFQIASRLMGGLILVEAVKQFAMSTFGSGIIFIIISIVFFGSSFFFLCVKEINPEDEETPAKPHTIRSMAASLKEIISNRNYMLYLLSVIELFVCFTIISFYADYAVKYYGISSAFAAGYFVVLLQAGAIISGIIFGWIKRFSIKNKLIASKLILISGILLLFRADNLFLFLSVSFIIGLSRGVYNVAGTPIIKKLSGKTDATDYYAISPMLQLPVSFGLPILSGVFLDKAAGLGILSYQILFGILTGLVLFSMGCVLKINKDF